MTTDARQKLLQRRAGVLQHSDGCPGDRIETIESRRPRTGELVRVDRCISCGEQIVTAGATSTKGARP